MLKLFIIALSLFAAMLVCALLGYSFVKVTEPDDEKTKNSIEASPEPIFVNETVELPILPGQLQSPAEEETAPPPDKNDYLVIWEDDAVKLYLIPDSGELIFSKVLEISPESLMEEDKALLKEGIILTTEEELASLLEDYTS